MPRMFVVKRGQWLYHFFYKNTTFFSFVDIVYKQFLGFGIIFHLKSETKKVYFNVSMFYLTIVVV